MDISSKQLRRQKTETNLAKMDQKSCSKLKKKKNLCKGMYTLKCIRVLRNNEDSKEMRAQIPK